MKIIQITRQITLMMIAGIFASSACAEIRLASDWKTSLETPSSDWETTKLDTAAFATADKLNATSGNVRGTPSEAIGFQLYFGDTKYYLQPMRFMAKDRPEEVCTPEDYKNVPTYKCKEGQRLKSSCHLLFFNANFENVGVHRIRVNEPYETYCNAVPAIGVFDRKRNELLVTLQYFPIDRKAASKVSEIGSGWSRMTSLFRLQEVNGKIVVEQDDRCLKNPNAIETIPDARKALKACALAQGDKQ